MPVPSPESPESSTEALFRLEALAHHRRAGGAEPLEPLRIPGRGITVAYRAVGVLLAGSLIALCLVHVDGRVRGRFVASRAPGRTDAWQVTATFGWRYHDALAPGQPVRLSDDAGCLDLVTSITQRDEAPGLAGQAGAQGSQSSEPLVTVHGEIAGSACAGDTRAGAAEATLETAPLILVVFPQLRAPLARLREAM